MSERSKAYLKQEFRDGERPSGADFGDLIDSFVTKVDDGITVDADGNLDLPGGLTLGDATNGQAGTLRFNGGQVQFHNGLGWNSLSTGSGGAFEEVAGGPHVAFGGGNVGIGTFATAPTFKLEVDLGQNNTTDQRVRFGNAVLSNGQGASAAYAQFSHQDQAAGNNTFALRQGPSGDVNLNAANNQPITISHNRTQSRVFIAPTGQVVIGNNALLSGAGEILQVNGTAGKTQGGNNWSVISDARLKTDIRPFDEGLSQLMQVKPIKFKYNGQLNTNTQQEEIGVLGQEIEKVFPYMVTKAQLPNASEPLPDDLRMYNNSALTYVMVNAIKELAERVVQLEAMLGLKDRDRGEA